jgi:hypothetical protein
MDRHTSQSFQIRKQVRRGAVDGFVELDQDPEWWLGRGWR